MSFQVNYYTQTEAEDAMSVVAGWIGQNRNIKVQYHKGTAVDADINTGVLRIPRMACASGITHEALMLLRSRVYHEAGHIDETDVNKPPKALGEIMNALEDRRMEASESKKHKGCEVAFRWANEWYNKDIASRAIKGEINAPLWEALCGMSFLVEGLQPLWTLSPKAQTYVDAAYSEFAKVTLCKNATDCLELAKKVLALLDDANEQYKKENPNPEKSKSKPQKGDGEKPEKGDGEPQSGGQGDLDDEDESEGEGGESDDEGKGKKSGKSKPKKDEGEEGEEDDAKSGRGDKRDKDEDGSKGDEDGEEDADGDDSGTGDGAGDEDSDDEAETESDDGKKEDGVDADSPYKPDDSRCGDHTTGDGTDEPEKDEWKDTSLDDELDGMSKDAAINEAIEDFFDDMDPEDAAYLSRRDLDEHQIPPTRDEDKATFKKERETVAVMAASMTRALEQALRSLCRCKRQGYMRQGRLDHKRLVAISKGLSKEIFFKVKDGQKMECAVEIIIDESGSMGNYRAVRLLAMAIGEALDAIGVPFEITGTTTKYGSGDYGCPNLDHMTRTNPIKYNHYVLFGDKWAAVRHRLVHTGAHIHNIDGEAIEYCVFRLQQRSERRKVVFSLSDGEPCGGQGTDTQLGGNIRHVCKKARKAGVEVYGFGIGTTSPKKYYGDKFFVFLDDVTTMSQTFIRKFADVITGGQVRV